MTLDILNTLKLNMEDQGAKETELVLMGKI